MGSRAVVDRLPRRDGRSGTIRRDRPARRASSTPAPAGGSSRRADLERQLLDRVRAALTAADFWAEFGTAWVCLDCELMPWSAKAQELLRSQYAAVGAAGTAALPHAVAVAGGGRPVA